MAAAGRSFAASGVSSIYLLHGTFAGVDMLGLYTDLERIAPSLTSSLRQNTKRAFDAIVGETGNYTRAYAQRLEQSLTAGAGTAIPVRLFYWSSMNHHISRADAAVRLIDTLAQTAPADSTPDGRRTLLIAHSHGGNALAIVTNLLGADAPTRSEFFEAARVFHGGCSEGGPNLSAWRRVEQILADPAHPIRRMQFDIATFGTPVRYGWDAGGYSKLLHFINHRRCREDAEHATQYPPHLLRLLLGREGDFVQQLGIAGSNLPPLPIAWRTFLADRRLGRLLQRGLPYHWIRTRLKQGMRVPEEGTTLLIEYDDPDRLPYRHLFGHGLYTRSRWMALHCQQIAQHFYSDAQAS
jgi:hypothetical protein